MRADCNGHANEPPVDVKLPVLGLGRWRLPTSPHRVLSRFRVWKWLAPCPFIRNTIDNWSLTSLQQRLVKTGGRLVKHARYYWLLLADGRLTRRLFGAMLRRIAALPVATG